MLWACVWCVALAASGARAGVLPAALAREIEAVKAPVESVIVDAVSSQCSHVKRLAGVSYEQVAGDRPPDLGTLTLVYLSQAVNVSYNLSLAPELLPQAPGWNPSAGLLVYVHGFTDGPDGSSFAAVRSAYSAEGKPALALDGSALLRWLYLRSSTYVRFMGEQLGRTLHALVKTGLDPASIHIIGHSLGSHIAGFAGKEFTRLQAAAGGGARETRVGRITALDPAGPCFSHVDPELRVKKTDADYVDAIHTDAGVFGLDDDVGVVDYYPNRGRQQPGCVLETCSHSRAWQLYANSVKNPTAFPARRCRDWEAFRKRQCDDEISYMGRASNGTGRYFLQTSDKEPYSLGAEGATFDSGKEAVVNNIGSFVSDSLHKNNGSNCTKESPESDADEAKDDKQKKSNPITSSIKNIGGFIRNPLGRKTTTTTTENPAVTDTPSPTTEAPTYTNDANTNRSRKIY